MSLFARFASLLALFIGLAVGSFAVERTVRAERAAVSEIARIPSGAGIAPLYPTGAPLSTISGPPPSLDAGIPNGVPAPLVYKIPTAVLPPEDLAAPAAAGVNPTVAAARRNGTFVDKLFGGVALDEKSLGMFDGSRLAVASEHAAILQAGLPHDLLNAVFAMQMTLRAMSGHFADERTEKLRSALSRTNASVGVIHKIPAPTEKIGPVEFNRDVRRPLLRQLYDVAAQLDTVADAAVLGKIAAAMESSLEAAAQILASYSPYVARLLSQNSEPRVENVELSGLIQSIADQVKHDPILRERGLRLEFGMPPQVHVRADRGNISIVVRNLVQNALKYSYDRGLITIRIAPDPEDSGRVIVSIQDKGIGISQADQRKIFNGFRTADSESHAKGTGVGLTLVERLLREQSSAISVKSVRRNGSTFSFSLPLWK